MKSSKVGGKVMLRLYLGGCMGAKRWGGGMMGEGVEGRSLGNEEGKRSKSNWSESTEESLLEEIELGVGEGEVGLD